MADEPNTKAGEDEQNRLLREEIAEQREEARQREAREKRTEELKTRVSVAAIVLTTALSFIGNVKSDRSDAVGSAKAAEQRAEREATDLWGYYQTRLAERTSLQLAHDRMQMDLMRRGVSREDPSVKLDLVRMSDYERRIADFDADTQQVYFRVQDLELEQDLQERRQAEPAHAVARYDLAVKLITLALILLSVTILSNKEWLFWGGIVLGGLGVLVGFNGYFLFF
jgi:hypothetical protein